MNNRTKNEYVISLNESETLASLNTIFSAVSILRTRLPYEESTVALLTQIEKSCYSLCSTSTRSFTELRHLAGKTPYLPAIFTFGELFSDIKEALFGVGVYPRISVKAETNTIVCDREKFSRALLSVIAAALVLNPETEVKIEISDDEESVFVTLFLFNFTLKPEVVKYLNSNTDDVLNAVFDMPPITSNLVYTKIVADIHKGSFTVEPDEDGGYTAATFKIPKKSGYPMKTVKENRKFIVSLNMTAREEFETVKKFIIKDEE
jgi:hypothetical protein